MRIALRVRVRHDVENCCFKAGAEIGFVLITHRAEALSFARTSSFQAGEREVTTLATEQRARQCKALGIAVFRGFFDERPARET